MSQPVPISADQSLEPLRDEQRSIGRRLSSPSVGPTAPSATELERRPSTIGRVAFWLVLMAVAGAGWWSFPRWWPLVVTWTDPLVKAILPAAPPAKPGGRPQSVLTRIAERRDVQHTLDGLGTVTPFQAVTVRSRIDGELLRVHFEEGQLVEAGQLLAEIDDRGLRITVEQLERQRDRDDATLRSARQTLTRYQSLRESQVIPGQQLDDQQALVDQASATLAADLAEIANARLQLEYCRVLAPISGRIGLRRVDAGNLIRATDTTGIAVITQFQPIAVVFTIPQDQIARVQQRFRGEPELSVEAYDQALSTKLATGRLAAIDNQVDAATGTVRLKAVFANEDESLFPNQFVNIRLAIDREPDAVVVPAVAVQRGPVSPYVFVVNPDETVSLRPVEVGIATGLDVVIRSGVQEGETVVTDGLDRLKDGAKVALRSNTGTGSTSARASGSPAPAASNGPAAVNGPAERGGR